MCKACEKTSESSEMPGNGITKDDQDVSDEPSPLLHDPLITEAINMFNATFKKPKRHWAGMRRARLPIKMIRGSFLEVCTSRGLSQPMHFSRLIVL
jgi:hypothetical protein